MDMEVEEWSEKGVQRNGSYSVTSGKYPELWKNLSWRTPFAAHYFLQPQSHTDL